MARMTSGASGSAAPPRACCRGSPPGHRRKKPSQISAGLGLGRMLHMKFLRCGRSTPARGPHRSAGRRHSRDHHQVAASSRLHLRCRSRGPAVDPQDASVLPAPPGRPAKVAAAAAAALGAAARPPWCAAVAAAMHRQRRRRRPPPPREAWGSHRGLWHYREALANLWRGCGACLGRRGPAWSEKKARPLRCYPTHPRVAASRPGGWQRLKSRPPLRLSRQKLLEVSAPKPLLPRRHSLAAPMRWWQHTPLRPSARRRRRGSPRRRPWK